MCAVDSPAAACFRRRFFAPEVLYSGTFSKMRCSVNFSKSGASVSALSSWQKSNGAALSLIVISQIKSRKSSSFWAE